MKPEPEIIRRWECHDGFDDVCLQRVTDYVGGGQLVEIWIERYVRPAPLSWMRVEFEI